jgi:group II intron reverse transcriptase/maturase
MDLAWLKEAYRRTRKDAAPGVDGRTAQDSAVDLEANLQSLLDRAKSGNYRAPPVRRTYVPKPGSPTEQRPIGIPTFEDKVLQRAVTMLLEAVYEQDFLDGSYGFRPGRSAHQALETLRKDLGVFRGGWIVELDIRKCFDTLNWQHLRQILRQRIRDGVLLRLTDKWLKAGALEGETLSYPDQGSPQGSVISPQLANVYLHTVLDRWFEETVRPRLRGKASLVRFADDAVLLFEQEEDAPRVLKVLASRFEKFGLKLHPDKTRLLVFTRPSDSPDAVAPQTFDFLGFSHYWGRSRRGYWVVKRRTAKDRRRRALKAISQWCRTHRHRPLREQCQTLNQKLRGHFAYYGIRGNFAALSAFRFWVERTWIKWLNRRSQRAALTERILVRCRRQYPLLPARLNPRAVT